MKTQLALAASVALMMTAALVIAEPAPTTRPVPAILKFTMPRLDGTPQPLSAYAGKVLIIVNTASECGHTPQYAKLQALHDKYAGQGLAIIGFPSNDFGKQEPGTDSEIATFCKQQYGVTFDMFSKIDVKGESQAPLYKVLTSKSAYSADSGDVKWNFEKFLVNRQGVIVARFRSGVEPDDTKVVSAIEAELAKPAN